MIQQIKVTIGPKGGTWWTSHAQWLWEKSPPASAGTQQVLAWGAWGAWGAGLVLSASWDLINSRKFQEGVKLSIINQQENRGYHGMYQTIRVLSNQNEGLFMNQYSKAIQNTAEISTNRYWWRDYLEIRLVEGLSWDSIQRRWVQKLQWTNINIYIYIYTCLNHHAMLQTSKVYNMYQS